jgi:4-hydroxybenzoate polyprenyltransferase/phosphoserine phosphatase
MNATPQPSQSTVLCVDLDGTLIASDLLLESLLLLLKRNPLYLLQLPLWMLHGKANLKAEIASRVTLDPAALPYNKTFVAWLQTERQTGRSLWLCTAADGRLAAAVATHLGLFEGVVASDGRINLAGHAKADRLAQRFGERGFDYCGNEPRDLAIWSRAHGAIVVQGSAALERAAARHAPIVQSFPNTRSRTWALLRALRPHQWAKNVLVLVPLVAAHELRSGIATLNAAIALAAFCLCASSVYLLNDLLDLQSDRAHARKSRRPFASGEAPLLAGLLFAPVLLAAAAALCTLLPFRFSMVLLAYYGLTLAYSFRLKSLPIVDALVLAGLYTLRVIGGAAAAVNALSFWLLLFSVFLFLSLAFAKRYAELEALRSQQRLRAAGRGYHVEDLALLQSLGTAAGYLSVLVLALYINSPEISALYRHPKVIWLLCVLMLYWVSRVWMVAQRGEMHDDPVIFALKDPVSIGIGALALIAVALAI